MFFGIFTTPKDAQGKRLGCFHISFRFPIEDKNWWNEIQKSLGKAMSQGLEAIISRHASHLSMIFQEYGILGKRNWITTIKKIN